MRKKITQKQITQNNLEVISRNRSAILKKDLSWWGHPFNIIWCSKCGRTAKYSNAKYALEKLGDLMKALCWPCILKKLK